MIRMEEWMDINELHRQGLSQRQIARLTGHSRNTVAKVLSQVAPVPFAKPARRSCLEPYKPYVAERFERYGLSARRLCGEIRAQGYTGSVDVVERFLKPLKDAQRVRAKATVRFETAPGEQAQADWAFVGEDEAGKIHAFVMVLCFSRMLYVEFVRSMDTATLVRCHQNAFSFYGGVPQSVLFDNQAQVKLPSGKHNPLFWDFALHYGFVPKTHRPYRPRTKGKVERMVDYLKDNFLLGRPFAGFDDLRLQGERWLSEANARLHATTGERPEDLLPREGLTPFSQVRPYVLSERAERRVDSEGFVQMAGARYSVPPSYVGQKVVVVRHQEQVEVRQGDAIIASHHKAAPGASVAAREHIDALWEQTLQRSAPIPSKVEFTSAHLIKTPPLRSYEEVAS